MYSKKDILKELNDYNYFIDELTLNSFVKSWKIDPIYEDEDGVEFFDNLSLIKLKKGISLKSQGYANEDIVPRVTKILTENLTPKDLPTRTFTGEGLQNVTIDVTKQTLEMLADAVAEKITADIKEQVKNSEFVQQLLQDGSLKKDNEHLSLQVEELTEDNKKMAQRIDKLEKIKKVSFINFDFFKQFFN